ncbi:MAG: hypothetical protein JXR80_06455 [Deltaproteobacteria bacterium]|nr:hypothetical protein [Deltaproteobacteria bacterium]
MTQIRSLFFENLTLKILSLLLAGFLWFFVSGKSKTELALSVPVEFTSIPTNMTIMTKVPTSIHIRVKGTKTLLRPLTSKPPSLSINLAKATTGKNVIRLEQETFNDLPLGVDVVNLDPETLTIYLDRFVNIELPIEMKTMGELTSGFQIKSIKINPPAVLCRVSEEYLKKQNVVFTEPLDLNSLKESVTLDIALQTPPNELKLVDPAGKISATIEIGETLVQRVIKGIRIDFQNWNKEIGHTGISNYFVDLVVECPLLMQVDDIRKQAHINVDLASLTASRENGYYTFPAVVELPENVKLLSQDPTEVEVVFKKFEP